MLLAKPVFNKLIFVGNITKINILKDQKLYINNLKYKNLFYKVYL
jgi:hypothetical protein